MSRSRWWEDRPHEKRHARSPRTGAAPGPAPHADARPDAAARAGDSTRPDAAASGTTALSDAPEHGRDTAGADERDRPLAAYAFLSALFAVGFGAPLVAAERRGALPERLAAADVVLIAASTFKLSRMLTRDAVTGFVRAPFVEYEGMKSVTTPKERPRGRGLRRAVGQLLVCPGCVGAWAAASLTAAVVAKPRPTRVVCSALTAFAASDFLQAGYGRAAKS